MDYIHALLLGIIQGFTEWLPISSSAHLVLFQKYVVGETSPFIDALAHLGTLLSVLILYGKEFFKILWDLFLGGEKRKYGLKLVIGSLPIVIVGLLFANFVENAFKNPSKFFIAICLLITASFLFATKFAKCKREKLSYRDALLIGISQVFALLPGISRSGITISTGNIIGVERKSSMLFSFYLAIIAIAGANILEFIRVDFSTVNLSVGLIILLSSFIVGVIALIALRKIIIKEKFYLFGFYCLILGILLFLL